METSYLKNRSSARLWRKEAESWTWSLATRWADGEREKDKRHIQDKTQMTNTHNSQKDAVCP